MAQQPIEPIQGGTGVANNDASTLTISGAFPLSLTLLAASAVTVPATGTLLSTTNAAGNFVQSIAGTTNQITASSATGAVTLSISSSYPGQTSITTLGTVTTGTWTGTTVGAGYGGTGSNTVPTTGQFLYSSAGTSYVPTSLLGTANQIIVTPSSGTVTLSLPQSIGTTSTPTFNQVTLNTAPVNSTDAATKAYVDASSSALNVHAAADVLADSTNTQITGATYTSGGTGADGGTGVGATLTDSTTGSVLVVDGHTVALTERVLVNAFTNGTAAAENNGCYTLTTVGVAGTTPWVLTRSTDYNNATADEVVPGDFFFVSEGTVYGGTGWVETDLGSLTPNDGIKIGTDQIYFTQFSGPGSGVASLTVSGAGLSVNQSTGAVTITNTGVTSLAGTAGEIAVSNSTGAATLSFPANVSIPAPASGIGLVANGASGSPVAEFISGSSSSTAADDLVVARNGGSTANTVGTGPNVVLADNANGTDTMLQHSGGQTELWQYNGAWKQLAYWNTTGGLNVNGASSGATLTLPYSPVSGANTFQIGAAGSFGTNNYELGIGIPSGGAHWPFGIVNNGTAVFTINDAGSVTAATATVNGTVTVNSGTTDGIDVNCSSSSPWGLKLTRTDLGNFAGWYNSGTVAATPIMETNAEVTAPNYIANAPSGGKGLWIYSSNGTTGVTDLQISRAGSTANTIASGPCLQLQDTTNNDGAIVQMSGGQYEVWTNVANAGWVQGFFLDTGARFTANTLRTKNGYVTSLNGATRDMLQDQNNGILVLNPSGNFTTIANNATTQFNYACRFANNAWNVSADGTNRFYFATNADSYWEAHANYHHFRNGSDADVVTIDMSGNIVANGNVTAGSDVNLKTEIEPLRDALNKIRVLNGITFRYKDQEVRSTGLLAQDVEKVLPEAVGESSTGFKTLAYGNLAGLIVEAIKELEQKVDTLAAKIENL